MFGKKYIQYTGIKADYLDDETNVEISKIQDPSKWLTFRDSINTRLSQIIDDNETPIHYVITQH